MGRRWRSRESTRSPAGASQNCCWRRATAGHRGFYRRSRAAPRFRPACKGPRGTDAWAFVSAARSHPRALRRRRRDWPSSRAPPRPPRGARCVLPRPRQRATGEPPHPTRPPTGRSDVALIQHGYVAATVRDTTSAFSRHPRRRRPRRRRAGVARRVHPTEPPNPPHRARMPRHSHHEPPPARLLLRMRLRGAVLLPYIRLGPAQLHRIRPPPPQLPGARPASATATAPRPSRRRHTAAASSRHTPRHEPLSVSVSLPLPASIPVPVSAA